MLNIPIPEYCTLARASALLGCEISDLIHFGEIGAITICIKVPKSTKALVHVFKRDEETVYDIESSWCAGGRLSEFVTIDDPLENLEADYEHEFRVPAFISGIWGLLKCSNLGDVYQEIPCEEMVVLTATDRPFIAILNMPDEEWGVDEIIKTEPENMYILGSDIEKLINNSGKRFPCRFNEAQDELPSIKPTGEIISNNEDLLSPKTIRTRTQFIKSLLYIHYGYDVAENPRRFMDNNDSEISTDFRNKEITPPSGKTVQDWINFTEIPFKNQE